MNEKNRITEQAEQELVKEQMRLKRKIHEWLLEEENDAPDIQEAERVGKVLEAVNDERLELLQKQLRAAEAHRKASERIQYAHILYVTWGEKRQTQTTYPDGGCVAQIFGLLAESIELLEEEIGSFMMQPSEAETTPAE
ncbi:MAG: hypothetical protein IJ343_15680 [Clostridia bacterium]|nr:hypothetical protein [Clostridia bacterium]